VTKFKKTGAPANRPATGGHISFCLSHQPSKIVHKSGGRGAGLSGRAAGCLNTIALGNNKKNATVVGAHLTCGLSTVRQSPTADCHPLGPKESLIRQSNPPKKACDARSLDWVPRNAPLNHMVTITCRAAREAPQKSSYINIADCSYKIARYLGF